jgi:hypothetical protein
MDVFMETKKSYNKELWLSILFLILGVLFIISLVFFFVFGPLIGSFFIALSVLYFAKWKYKKDIPMKNATILLLLPVLGASVLLLIMWQSPYGDSIANLLLILGAIVILVFFKKVKSA